VPSQNILDGIGIIAEGPSARSYEQETAGSESNRQDKYAGLLACPLLVFSQYPAEDGTIMPLHRKNSKKMAESRLY